jgi:hypothetical protein
MRSICWLSLLFVLALNARAQTASLGGQVTDETGAVVPGAKVTLTGPGGRVQSTTANEQGSYSVTGLTPGDYGVTGLAPQLATLQTTVIALRPGVQTLNLQLRVVSTTQQVTIQENAATVSTDPSSNAGAVVLRGADLQALSDDPDDLASDLQALAGPSAGPSGGAIFVDGFSGGEIPPKDSIREVRINQNPFSPEYDRLGYGRIEIFTKPGADHYRGTLDYNLGTDVWNSRNPYSAQKASLLLNEFEGNAAGPINKRASFTFDGQRNMVDNGAITNALTVDPKTFAIQPYFSAFTVPQRFTRASPRIDYRINDNNTLIIRYTATHSDINGAGIGSFDLSSRGYDYRYLNQTVQVTDTIVLGSAVNDTRFQYYRSAAQRIATNPGPVIQVLGAFNEGGSQVGRSFDTQNSFELQNYTALTHGAHLWKFGIRLRGSLEDSVSPNNFNGTFTFNSLDAYRQTLVNLASSAPIRAAGGGAAQFSISAGVPGLAVHQEDVGVYAGDDWHIRPNVTLSTGLRYETQTNIHDWFDFAPRIAVAWAPTASPKNPRPKTVLRFGFGTFYDRFPLASVLAAHRFNGVLQQQYVVTNPDFFPLIPSLGGLQGTPQVVQELSRNLRAPYVLQSSATLERQLPSHTTLAVTYTNSHALHVLHSDDINAPLPGTFVRGVPGSGKFPLGQPNPVFLMESSGLYNQNQLIVNVNTKVSEAFSLFGFYVLNRADSNSDGLATFPANPYNLASEYGPAATDVRHRTTIGGSISTRWNVRLSPFFTIQSGPPFNITAGSDLYGTTLFNGRPGFATSSTTGAIHTAYGWLDPNPTADERLVPRNYGRGPGQLAMNIRVSKTFGFGGERGEAARRPTGGQVQNAGGANPNLASGRGLGSLIAPSTTSHRYNVALSMSARNVLNHTNPGPIIGDITSPLFGRANQMAGNLNGEGFSENADNRRLEMQIRFTF